MPLFCFLGLFLCLCSYHTVQLHTDSNYTGERRAPTPTLFLNLCLRLLWPEAGDGKLRPTGPIQPVTCICKHNFIGGEPQACVCMLSTAAFTSTNARKTICSIKQNIHTIWPTTKSLHAPGLKHGQFSQMFNTSLKKKKSMFSNCWEQCSVIHSPNQIC